MITCTRRIVLAPALLAVMAGIWPCAEVRAGFTATVEYSIYAGDGPQNGVQKSYTNSTSLTPISLDKQFARTGLGPDGTAFASVNAAGPGGPAIVDLGVRATANLGSLGFENGMNAMFATAKASWQDQIYATWLSDEPRPNFVLGAAYYLDGYLSAVISDGIAINVIAAVDLRSFGRLEHIQQQVSGLSDIAFEQFEDREYLFRDVSGVNIFGPQGLRFSMELWATATGTHVGLSFDSIQAVSDFGHTASFLGFMALDPQGNVIQGMDEKIRLTSDSGVNYQFINAFPTTAVPEPSSMVTIGIGLLGLLAHSVRRSLGN